MVAPALFPDPDLGEDRESDHGNDEHCDECVNENFSDFVCGLGHGARNTANRIESQVLGGS